MSDRITSHNRFVSSSRISWVLALIAIMSVGCSRMDVADKEIPLNGIATDRQQNQTNSVSVASNVEAESPAASQNRIPDADASPVMVCEKFVQFLNDDNRQNVELLLTPTALTVTSRAEFHIPAIGEPNSKFKLSQPQFSTSKQKLCYVDCRISTQVDEKDIQSEITWMLRRQKMGWRIAGMLVADITTGELDLLSFESLNDVMRIKNDLSQEVTIDQRNHAIIGQSTSRKP